MNSTGLVIFQPMGSNFELAFGLFGLIQREDKGSISTDIVLGSLMGL